MKNVKRILSLILVSVMVLAMSLPVFAADPNPVNITMGSNGNKFAGFKLLDIESYKIDPATNEKSIVYKVNDTYRDVLKTALGVTTDEDIIKKLGTYTSYSADLYALAKKIHTAVGNTGEFSSVTENGKQVFKGLNKGYYLFVETELQDPADPKYGPFDDFSSPMLVNVLDESFAVQKKDGEVTDEKEVKETDDSTPSTSDWQKHGDYDIGDSVPFKLTGTVSSNYDNYTSYFYKFYDRMDKGLTFDGKSSVHVFVDGTEITTGFVVDDTYVDTDGRKGFTVTFADLKKIAAVKANSKITVEFTATLNANAIIGNPGNKNESNIEYSNNPDTDDKGVTPKKIVVVFTYKLVVNKVNEQNQPLDGAEFALYKLDNYKGAQVDALKKLGYTGKYVQVTVTKSGTTFTSERLDDGKYLLVETKTPAGYNSIDPIEFEIVAQHAVDTTTGLMQITSLELVPADPFSNIVYTPLGTITADVMNKPGVELPETGGIGTTIFYIVGALMALGAGVVLVTRRRVQK